MLRKFFLAVLTATSFFSAFSQDTTKTIAFSGSIDAYYRHNLAGETNNYTSFTNSHNSFELGMATLKIEGTALSNKVGATVDLGFGRRAEEFSYNDGEWGVGKNGFTSLAAIKQAFITYAATSKLKITAGKFTTHVGYEMLDATANKNYSMSYMFTNGPFFHTGIKADYTMGKFGAMIGITNYADQTTASASVKNLIAQVSGASANGKIKAYLNYSGFAGSDSGKNPSALKAVHQVDVVLNTIINKNFGIGYNGTIQSRRPTIGKAGNWIGNAIYINYDPANTVGICVRSEYIIDSKTIYFATKNILANTISLNYKVGALTIIPELRFESAQSDFYFKKDGGVTKSTASGLLAVVYKF